MATMRLTLISFLALMAISFSAIAQSSIALVDVKENIVSNSNFLDNTLTSTFHLHRGKILVDLDVNGHSGLYLLDTGADAIIINGVARDDASYTTSGLSASNSAEPVIIEQLNWGNNEFHDLPAFKTDLRQLEDRLEMELAGIIGNEFLGQGAMHIDYQSQILSFLPSPNPRQMKKAGWKAHQLHKIGHLQALKLKVNGETHFFGLDTGAEINLLVRPSQKIKLNDVEQKIFGIQAQEQKAKQACLDLVEIGKEKIAIGQLYFCPLLEIQNHFKGKLSGLLGFPFFERNHFVLDMNGGVLYLKEG